MYRPISKLKGQKRQVLVAISENLLQFNSKYIHYSVFILVHLNNINNR